MLARVFPGLLCLLALPLAQAEPAAEPVVTISLADTAAQKARLQVAIRSAPGEPLTLHEKMEQRAEARGKRKASSDFDDHFKKYSKHYFGIHTDWRWFQAQAMVESEMKPTTRSRSGAMGLMQIMPRTFHEIRARNPHLKDPFDPHFSIAAGIYYNRQLYDAWSDISSSEDRRRFMFASYNAGLGSVQRAARRAGNPASYSGLEPALSAGPRHYVAKIERERKKLHH